MEAGALVPLRLTVRVRPKNPREKLAGHKSCVTVQAGGVVSFLGSLEVTLTVGHLQVR